MFTRTRRPYDASHSHPAPQDDHIQELIQQMTAMNRQIDLLYGRVFERPEGSGNHNKDGNSEANSQKNGDEGEEPPPCGDERVPYRPLARGHHQPLCMGRGENFDYHFDEATRRVRVDIPDFHG
jgi:hypothetical protein